MSNYIYCCVRLVVIISTAANGRMEAAYMCFPQKPGARNNTTCFPTRILGSDFLYTVACTPSRYSVRCKSEGAVMVAMGGFLPCHHTTSKPGHATGYPQTARTSFPCLALSSDALHRRTLKGSALRILLLIVEETPNRAITNVLASLA